MRITSLLTTSLLLVACGSEATMSDTLDAPVLDPDSSTDTALDPRTDPQVTGAETATGTPSGADGTASELQPGPLDDQEDNALSPTSSSSDGTSLPSAACSAPTVAEQQQLAELTVNGVRRQYRLSVPSAGAGTALPVLMAFHGGGGRDFSFPQESRFEQLAVQEGVIMVYPLAELVPPNEGEWQLNTDDSSMQDIDFLNAIIDELSSRLCVDMGRIYGTGYSLGSMFAYEVACQMNDRFAAIASYAGTMPVSPNDCVMEENVALMHLHGREDGIIAYDNQWDWKEWDSVGTMRDIPGLVDFWSDSYNCEGLSETPSGSGTHFIHDRCDGGGRVEHHAVDGVGHEWPSSIGGVSTHQLIWDFLSEFQKTQG